MARTTAASTVDDVIRRALAAAMVRIAPKIAKSIADAAASQIEHELMGAVSHRTRSRRGARPRQRVEIHRWVADSRARRVPTFVIEMTGGLDTKKKIVAKYGEATFENGKPLPPILDQEKQASGKKIAATKSAAKIVQARAPVVRKAGASGRK